METQANPNWGKILGELRECGAQLANYERKVINLIASDNAYPSTLSYSPPYEGYMIQEGLLRNRPFAGAALHDEMEEIGVRAACHVFGAEHANLQPHSCSQANQAAYHALLKRGDSVLALGFQAGGHLTHGLKINFSGRAYNFAFYGTTSDGTIDYDSAEKMAQEHSPKLIICGSSSYPRLFDSERLRSIADSVGAYLMFDLSHEAGLIAGKAIPNPVPLADVVTLSMDKTLRGPFGGLILCKEYLASAIDKAVHPGTQSSFSVRKISDTAHALILTQGQEFREYADNVLLNAKVMEKRFSQYPNLLLTGGTDKHYVILDVKNTFGMTGADAEQRLEKIGVLSSRQTIPSDKSNRMAGTGGLRLGTAWATSRGYREPDFVEITNIICEALSSENDPAILSVLSEKVASLALCTRANDVWLSAHQTPHLGLR